MLEVFLEIKLSVKNVGKSRLWFVDLREEKKRFPATFNRKTKCSFKHKIANCQKTKTLYMALRSTTVVSYSLASCG